MSSENSAIARLFRLTDKQLLLIFVAGVIGELYLEAFSWGIVPEFTGRPMRPDILVSDLARALGSIELWRPLAIAIHLFLGAVLFPVIYLWAKPILKNMSWLVVSILVGVLLWLIAQSILAPTAGRPIFLGFITYTWASLAAHTTYMVVVAYIYEKLAARFSDL